MEIPRTRWNYCWEILDKTTRAFSNHANFCGDACKIHMKGTEVETNNILGNCSVGIFDKLVKTYTKNGPPALTFQGGSE